jgi:hypothetical protein
MAKVKTFYGIVHFTRTDVIAMAIRGGAKNILTNRLMRKSPQVFPLGLP